MRSFSVRVWYCFLRNTMFRSHYIRDVPKDGGAASLFDFHWRIFFLSFSFYLLRNLSTSEILILSFSVPWTAIHCFCVFCCTCKKLQFGFEWFHPVVYVWQIYCNVPSLHNIKIRVVIYNWLIKRHVSALLGNRQAYKEIVFIIAVTHCWSHWYS